MFLTFDSAISSKARRTGCVWIEGSHGPMDTASFRLSCLSFCCGRLTRSRSRCAFDGRQGREKEKKETAQSKGIGQQRRFTTDDRSISDIDCSCVCTGPAPLPPMQMQQPQSQSQSQVQVPVQAQPPSPPSPSPDTNQQQTTHRDTNQHTHTNNTPAESATSYSSTSASISSSHPKSSRPAVCAPPPTPWEPRTINLYKRDAMTLIGEGTYGSVWMARAPNGTRVALKKIRKEKKEGFPITAIREIKLLKAVKHPNVVILKDVVSSHMPGKEGDVFMVFEFLEHDLTGLLESKVPLSDGVIKYYLKSILEGIAYLHSRSILHRDIKGANILISNNGDVKIADLGLARSMAKGGYTNRVVTLWYRAPELLLGACDYDSKIDIWSVGCLMAELLTRGTVLFPGSSTELDQLNKIFAACGSVDETNWPGVSKLKYFQQFTPKPQRRILKEMFRSQRSSHAVDLLDKLLTLNPAERPTAEQALDHEYFFEEPLPIQPHQHPIISGNHHEFGSKQRRRNPPPANNNNKPASIGGPPTTNANQHHHSNQAGPRPFDRMQVTSHERLGMGGFALNQQPPQQQPPMHHQGGYSNQGGPSSSAYPSSTGGNYNRGQNGPSTGGQRYH